MQDAAANTFVDAVHISMNQDASSGFRCLPPMENLVTLIKQDPVAKAKVGFTKQPRDMEISDEVADAVMDASKVDVYTAYAQLRANTQQLLERLELDKSNPELYRKVRQNGAIAVSHLRAALNFTEIPFHSNTS